MSAGADSAAANPPHNAAPRKPSHARSRGAHRSLGGPAACCTNGRAAPHGQALQGVRTRAGVWQD
eukprot:4529783-Pyramimonas_sp.AAC.1